MVGTVDWVDIYGELHEHGGQSEHGGQHGHGEYAEDFWIFEVASRQMRHIMHIRQSCPLLTPFDTA